MFGRRSHGEKTSNGKPVKKIIKTANEEVVLGAGHTTVKSISDEVLFLCCFPHSESLRAANSEFPFHGF